MPTLPSIIRHALRMDKKTDSTTSQNAMSTSSVNYVAPPEGSLGLLALGWQGLRAWRAARIAAESSTQEKDEQKG